MLSQLTREVIAGSSENVISLPAPTTSAGPFTYAMPAHDNEHGTALLTNVTTGEVHYTAKPRDEVTARDQFSYEVADARGTVVATGTVSIKILPSHQTIAAPAAPASPEQRFFGYAVDFDESGRLIIGDFPRAAHICARSADDGRYHCDPGSELTAPAELPTRGFGQSVALEGDWAIVGSGGDDSTPEGEARDVARGHVYFYKRVGSQYAFHKRISSENVGKPTDDFGRTLSLHGSTLVIADGRDCEALKDAQRAACPLPSAYPMPRAPGAVYVYELVRGDAGQEDWVFAEKVFGSTTSVEAALGTTLAVHGNRLIAAAPGDGAASAFRKRVTWQDEPPQPLGDDALGRVFFTVAAGQGVAMIADPWNRTVLAYWLKDGDAKLHSPEALLPPRQAPPFGSPPGAPPPTESVGLSFGWSIAISATSADALVAVATPFESQIDVYRRAYPTATSAWESLLSTTRERGTFLGVGLAITRGRLNGGQEFPTVAAGQRSTGSTPFGPGGAVHVYNLKPLHTR